MQGRISWTAWVLMVLCMGALGWAAGATTQSAIGAFGGEKCRLVERPGEIVSILDNGLTVIVKRVPGPALSVRGYVAAGGLFEGKWLGGGLSHLLEHLVAGGSSQRRTEAQNRTLLQEIGNNSNAFTTSDHTAYFVNTTPEHLDQAVDLVTGWMLGARITQDEFNREHQVVQRELEMDEGEPQRVFWDLCNITRYRLSPARVPVIGYKPVIQTMTRQDVWTYYKMAYQPNNMVFAVVGDIDPQTMLKAVQKYVGDVPPGTAFSHDITPEPPVLSPRRIVATFPKLGQAQLQLAFPTVKLSSPDLYALDLLSSVLSDGNSSILVENLRDKLHLVSSISSYSLTPAYVPGSFAISMRLAPDKVEQATGAIFKILDQVQSQGVDAERLQRAKVQMKMDRLRSMQTAEQIASSMASDYLSTGDPHFTDHYLQRIEKLTPKQLQAVARKYFNRNKLLTTLLLPSEYVGSAGLPKAEDLLRKAAAATTQAKTPATHPSAITRIVLDNNLVVLLKPETTTPLVSVRMYALGGLTDETAGDNGIGNLAMSMLPRGTTSRSAEQIAQFFDSIGGELSTSCGNNTWYWNASFLNSDFDKAMAVYADVVNHPAFAADELAAMKPRILAAIASQDADWTNQAFRYFRHSYFGPQHSPYQFQSIGTADNVKAFTPEQLHKWYEQKILRAPRVLAIFGDIDREQAKAAAQKYFGGAEKLPLPPANNGAGQSTGPSSASMTPPTPSIQVERVEVQKTAQPLAGIVIGFDSRSVIGAPITPAITVADTLCSGFEYPTGYLHEVLRGQGLVYVVQAFNWPGRDKDLPGTFTVYAGCDPRNVNKVVELILENIARLQGSAEDINPSWFTRSKQLITTADAIDNQTPDARATTAALDELFGLGYDYHAGFARRIDSVTLEQVRDVSRSLLDRCVVTVSTPLPQAVDIKTGKRTYDSFPHIDLAPKGVVHDVGETK